jgi:hypothetical protein
MKISLKKANLIQQKLAEKIPSVFPSTLTVSIYSKTIDADIAEARDKFYDEVKRHGKLVRSLYELRDLIQKANHASGISTLMNKIALNQRMVSVYTGFSANSPMKPVSEISTQISAMLNAEIKSYGGSNLAIGILIKSDIEFYLKESKKALLIDSQLREELLELNVSTKIEIGEELVSLLKDEMII